MRSRAVWVGLLALALALAVAACGSSSGSGGSGSKKVLTVGYSADYVFDQDSDSVTYWNEIKKEFQAEHPGVTVQLEPHGGTDVDEMNAVALQFRTPSTTPDVIQMPTTYVGQFASSGYLLPLDKYVSSAPFWSRFPKSIQNEGNVNGHFYAVDIGENNSGIYYNKQMLKKAGVPLPWQPKNWADIIAVAKKVKAANPGVIPLWLAAGTSAGPTGVLQGSGAMIYASSTPTIYDTSTKKWVVNSPGLQQTLQFYKEVYADGLGAPLSQLFSPKSVAVPVDLMATKKLAIAIGANWYGGAWELANRQWLAAKTQAGAAGLPTSQGQSPGQGGTLGGWDMAVAKSAPDPQLAWDLVNLIESTKYMVFMANKAGFVPPDTQAAKSPAYINYAPPFNAAFATYLPYDKELPSNGGFAVWARGINQATGQLAQSPSTSVSSALATLKSTVTNQLGSGQVESLP